MIYPDMVRWAVVALAGFVGPLCGVAVAFGATWDQRLRFAVLLGYAAVTIGSTLNNLGRPLTWTSFALAVTTIAAGVSVSAFLLKARRALLATDGGSLSARPAASERSVQRHSPAAGSGRHTRRDPGPESVGRPA